MDGHRRSARYELCLWEIQFRKLSDLFASHRPKDHSARPVQVKISSGGEGLSRTTGRQKGLPGTAGRTEKSGAERSVEKSSADPLFFRDMLASQREEVSFFESFRQGKRRFSRSLY